MCINIKAFKYTFLMLNNRKKKKILLLAKNKLFEIKELMIV